MAFHPNITKRNGVETALETANRAMSLASRQMTHNSGNAYFHSGDGTGILIGDEAGEFNGIAINDEGTLKPIVDTSVIDADLEQAKTDIQTAQSNAQDALDRIGGVSVTANDAQSKAQAALDTADAAKQQSDRAESTAANAIASSGEATTTANTAKTTAEKALNDTVTQNVNQYAINDNPAKAPTTGWEPTAPAWTSGRYIWVRTVVGYGSGDYMTTDPVCVTGNTGLKGNDGKDGVDGKQGDTGKEGPAGKDGVDGTSVKIKGSVASKANLPSSATIGEGYLTDDTGHLYVWGDTGWTDVGVIRGPNGVSAYVHAAWANSLDGRTDFSLTDGGSRQYMGVYSDNTKADSTKPTDYVWTKIKGADGKDGADGTDGSNGSNGVSVTSIIRYYALGTGAPAKPAVSAPPSPWTRTEPGYVENQNLYTCEKVTYDNGSFSYTDVQLSSSYQYSAAAETAARQALQTSTQANTTANTAKNAADAAAKNASDAKTSATQANTTAANASALATQSKATADSAAQAAVDAQTAANMAAAQGDNLVINGSFETGTFDGWYQENGNAASVVTEEHDTGKYALKTNGNIMFRQVVGNAIPIVPQHTYRFSCRCKSTAAFGVYYRYYYTNTSDVGVVGSGPTDGVNLSAASVADWTTVSFDHTFTVGEKLLMARWGIYDSTAPVFMDSISIVDVTDMLALQHAADLAQQAADAAATAAKNADAKAVAANAAAANAQAQADTNKTGLAAVKTTADSKNTIYSSTTQPSTAKLVPGDLWFKLDANARVTGIMIWNGSKFVDYVLTVNALYIAGQIGTIELKDGAVTAAKVLADSIDVTRLHVTDEMTAKLLSVHKVQADEIEVNSLASALVTSGQFKTAGTSDYTIINDSGIAVYKNGVQYVYMGSNATYGIQAWNPVTGQRDDLSQMVFGAQKVVETNSLDTAVKHINTSGFTDWRNFNPVNQTFITPTGRAFVTGQLVFKGTAASDFVALEGNLNFARVDNGKQSLPSIHSLQNIAAAGLTAGIRTCTPISEVMTFDPNVKYKMWWSFRSGHVIGSGDCSGHCDYRSMMFLPI